MPARLEDPALDQLFRAARTRNGSRTDRSLGLDCGPMSGFDNAKVDALFFAGTKIKSNFLCSIGHGTDHNLFGRLPRHAFEEACKIV